ncbi:MAG: hypothetical protein ACE5IA_02320 [Dehalococcoidia bacterium]
MPTNRKHWTFSPEARQTMRRDVAALLAALAGEDWGLAKERLEKVQGWIATWRTTLRAKLDLP